MNPFRWDDADVRTAIVVALALAFAVGFAFLRHSVGPTLWRNINDAACPGVMP